MAKTQFDPRLYTAHSLARFFVPGGLPSADILSQRYFAIPGDRSVIAFDLLRDIKDCRASDDLGAQPGAIVFVFGALWVMLDNGVLQQLTLHPTVSLDNKGAEMWKGIQVDLRGNNRWLLSGGEEVSEARVDHLGQQLESDTGALRVRESFSNVLLAPRNAAGVASIDPFTGEILGELDSLQPQIFTGAYSPALERAYFFSDLGRMSVVSVSPSGDLALVRHIEIPHVMGLRTDARIVLGELVVCAHAYKRAYFFSLEDPDLPVLIDFRDYRQDPFQSPLTALEYVSDPVAFVMGGDSFFDFQMLPTTGVREASSEPADRVAPHGGMGGVSFAPALLAAGLRAETYPAFPSTGGSDGTSALAGGRYTNKFNAISVNPNPPDISNLSKFESTFTFPGDPYVLYRVTLRLRGLLESNGYFGANVGSPIPLTTRPVLAGAGYSPLAIAQLRQVRNVRYGNLKQHIVPPFSAVGTQDLHRFRITNPAVEYYLAACEDDTLDGSGDPRTQFVDPRFKVPPYNSGMVALNDTLIANIWGQAQIICTLDFKESIVRGTSANHGSLIATAGSPTIYLTGTLTSGFSPAGVRDLAATKFFGVVQSDALVDYATDSALATNGLNTYTLAGLQPPGVGVGTRFIVNGIDMGTISAVAWPVVTAGVWAGVTGSFLVAFRAIALTMDRPSPYTVNLAPTTWRIASCGSLRPSASLSQDGLTPPNPFNRELMPPDDDPARPLIIPWEPLHDMSGIEIPFYNFMQIDIVHSRLAI